MDGINIITPSEFLRGIKLIKGDIYKHMKSGNFYKVIDTCIEATNGDEDGMVKVIYSPLMDDSKKYVRLLDQFLFNMVLKTDIFFNDNDMYKVERDLDTHYRNEVWVRKNSDYTVTFNKGLKSIVEHKYFMIYSY